jgi:hypothetical protein
MEPWSLRRSRFLLLGWRMTSVMAPQRGAVDPGPRSSRLLNLCSCRLVCSLPWPRLHRRQYARYFDYRLAVVLRARESTDCKYVEVAGVEQGRFDEVLS